MLLVWNGTNIEQTLTTKCVGRSLQFSIPVWYGMVWFGMVWYTDEGGTGRQLNDEGERERTTKTSSLAKDCRSTVDPCQVELD